MKKETSELNIAKRNLTFIIIGIVVLIAVLIIYASSGKKKGIEIPDGRLSAEQGNTEYDINVERYPFLYNFNDVEYSIGCPSKGTVYCEGGYAYSLDSYGLVIAEIAPVRTLSAYSTDVYTSLYAYKGELNIEEIAHSEGYKNGYPAEYSVFKVNIPEKSNPVYEFAYLIKLGKENIVLLVITEDVSEESFNGAVNILEELTLTLTPRVEVLDERVETVENSEVIKDDIPDIDTKEQTREAFIVADNDYEQLLLTFSYMDVTAKPSSCILTTSNGESYLPSEEIPGTISFVIPNVTKGEELKLEITSGDLKGTTVEQNEYSVVEEETAELVDGRLHDVEELDEFVGEGLVPVTE